MTTIRMTRDEINAKMDSVRADTDTALDELRDRIRVEVELANGWALEALAETYVDKLKALAAGYEVEVTDDVVRGVWLASQLVLDIDPEMMLADG